ncbi:MAG: nuclease (SNase) [Alphaproteobacteria bacterium]|nr:MAG: nuclease (SNase) [Alphaproteobacteria bacterium]
MYGEHMHRIFTLFAILVCFNSPGRAEPSDLRTELKKSTSQKVTRIIDGDTVILKDQTRVRLVGIQAPKLPLGRRGFKGWPLGFASKKYLSDLILDKYVTLYFGGQRQDRYGRALAHLFLEDGTWVQGEMLKAGMARVYSFADNRAIIPEMLQAEQEARRVSTGIWALAFYQPKDQQKSASFHNSFQLVRGTVTEVAKIRGTYYVNFGEDWRQDFTIVIKSRAARKFIKAGIDPTSYGGKTIEVRGWLKSYNGPMIEVTHPEQIMIIQ